MIDKFYEELKGREVKEHKIIGCIPWRETCYGCRDHDHGGLNVRAYITEGDMVVGIAHTNEEQNGFPNVTHEIFLHGDWLKKSNLQGDMGDT